MIFWNKWGVNPKHVEISTNRTGMKSHTVLKELAEVEKTSSPGAEIWETNKSERKNGKLEIALASNPPKKSCRSGTFYLWHANGLLLHNVCPFLLFPRPHNGIKSSCVILMRGFLLSGFCQLDAIPTYKKSAVTTAPSVRPLNLRSYSFQRRRSWKKNWQAEEAASCSVTVSLEGHQLFIKPVREWYYQREWLNRRSHTGPHLLLGWFFKEGGSYWRQLFFVSEVSDQGSTLNLCVGH